MKIYNHINELADNCQYGLTIGNFDGVHLGHQYLLESVRKDCSDNNLTMAVMTFSPHPLVVLKGLKGFLVNDDEEKRYFLSEAGVGHLVVTQFNRVFSRLEPESFLDKYVLSNSSIKKIYLGHDFSFGSNKKGNHKFVKEYCSGSNIEVSVLGEHNLGNRKYSSTQVRCYLSEGNVNNIESLLGRHYSLSGVVSKGESRGKEMGFATANISVSQQKIIPKTGVYFSECLIKGKKFKSITNLGFNPTFVSNRDQVFIETHVLDFADEIYGELIEVIFLKRLRNEMKFDSAIELVNQIKQDIKKRIEYDY
jgi:riboflavin kinase/FMN adenylyltransferase